MHFIWHGNTCFKLQSKNADIILDPPSKKSGIKELRQKADIVTVSNESLGMVDSSTITGEPFQITFPGEYEVRGVMFEGIDIPHETDGVVDYRSTVFTLKDEGVTVCHLGFLDRELKQDELDRIGMVDVLLLPIGGDGSIKPSVAIKVVNAIEPRVVIPMYSKEGSTNAELASIADFEKEFSDEFEKPVDKIILKKKDFDPESTRVIQLKPQI
jgi:L-ascorbate metabolism protein UlaG (beta-lactamase superfamily)